MKKTFYVVVDLRSRMAVTIMPSYSHCQSVISNLPIRDGYSILKVPGTTKILDVEFSEELSQREILQYYKGLKTPLKVNDWYTNAKRTDLIDVDLPAPDSL